MSLFYGYEDENEEILRRALKHIDDDPKLSKSGGTMSGDIDMNKQALKNVANPVDDLDAISRKVLEDSLLAWKVIFNLNVSKETAAGTVKYHTGGTAATAVSIIGTGTSRLVQANPVYAPLLGGTPGSPSDFLSPDLTVVPLEAAGMFFNLPRAQYCDLNVFIVARRAKKLPLNVWEMLWANDDGGYDKFIGYRNRFGTDNKLAYGGGSRKEYICTIPNNIDTSKKHLISAHWLMVGSHIRVNALKSSDSNFEANRNKIGAPYSAVLCNIRGTTYSHPAMSEIYGIKIIAGYMTDVEISSVCIEMMREYNIT